MFCNKPSVNLLTAALLSYEICDIVVCPGSRNATLVHNFAACERQRLLRLYPVTDERSAAFVAIGVAVARQTPVAVCVTSGSALLNMLPAVAEAYYRHLPLLLISADRPEEWINQLDGQTIVQRDALQPYATTYQIAEEQAAWNERLLAEALAKLHAPTPTPVHLNVPLSEPLFAFTTEKLPAFRRVTTVFPTMITPFASWEEQLRAARFPLVYVGQIDVSLAGVPTDWHHIDSALLMAETFSQLKNCQYLSAYEQGVGEVTPDLVIHIGGNGVCKRLKQTLRQQSPAVWRIEPTRGMPDTFRGLEQVVYVDTKTALRDLYHLLQKLPSKKAVLAAKKNLQLPPWETTKIPVALRLFAQAIAPQKDCVVHLANSLAVRHAAKIWTKGEHLFYCNRGTNGIEGSLSTAVGYALTDTALTYCVIGDLSFFYDANALWNQRLQGNLRILLINNGGGRIFDHLEGLSASPVQGDYISANHRTTAKGICESYGVEYLSAQSEEELLAALPLLTTLSSSRPILLEVFEPMS